MKCRSIRTKQSPPRRPTAGVAVLGLISLSLSALAPAGCASLMGSHRSLALQPEGPGATFTTIEAAAIDAIAYSVLDGLRSGRADRVYGGTVTMTEDGYTYAEPKVAPPFSPLVTRYRVGSNDVARFHVYPKSTDMRDSQLREHASREDRVTVDRADPRRRPLFFLTPSMVVKAYYGKQVPEQELAQLGRPSDDLLVVLNDAPVR